MELPVSLCHHKPEPHLISARKQVTQTVPGPSGARWMAVRHHEPFPSCTKGALWCVKYRQSPPNRYFCQHLFLLFDLLVQNLASIKFVEWGREVFCNPFFTQGHSMRGVCSCWAKASDLVLPADASQRVCWDWPWSHRNAAGAGSVVYLWGKPGCAKWL